MSGGRGKGGKAKIQISKPEPPKFLQRIREQLVANEDADRKEKSIRKRKERDEKDEAGDDFPTVVKLSSDDLTEEEYKRMKKDLETQYKLDSEIKSSKTEELDIEKLIDLRRTAKSGHSSGQRDTSAASKSTSGTTTTTTKPSHTSKKPEKSSTKNLSYGSSSDEDD